MFFNITLKFLLQERERAMHVLWNGRWMCFWCKISLLSPCVDVHGMNFTISDFDSINLRKIGCIPPTRIVLHLAPICVDLEPTKSDCWFWEDKLYIVKCTKKVFGAFALSNELNSSLQQHKAHTKKHTYEWKNLLATSWSSYRILLFLSSHISSSQSCN